MQRNEFPFYGTCIELFNSHWYAQCVHYGKYLATAWFPSNASCTWIDRPFGLFLQQNTLSLSLSFFLSSTCSRREYLFLRQSFQSKALFEHTSCLQIHRFVHRPAFRPPTNRRFLFFSSFFFSSSFCFAYTYIYIAYIYTYFISLSFRFLSTHFRSDLFLFFCCSFNRRCSPDVDEEKGRKKKKGKKRKEKRGKKERNTFLTSFSSYFLSVLFRSFRLTFLPFVHFFLSFRFFSFFFSFPPSLNSCFSFAVDFRRTISLRKETKKNIKKKEKRNESRRGIGRYDITRDINERVHFSLSNLSQKEEDCFFPPHPPHGGTGFFSFLFSVSAFFFSIFFFSFCRVHASQSAADETTHAGGRKRTNNRAKGRETNETQLITF